VCLPDISSTALHAWRWRIRSITIPGDDPGDDARIPLAANRHELGAVRRQGGPPAGRGWGVVEPVKVVVDVGDRVEGLTHLAGGWQRRSRPVAQGVDGLAMEHEAVDQYPRARLGSRRRRRSCHEQRHEWLGAGIPHARRLPWQHLGGVPETRYARCERTVW
jgi:hypothetical protein